ncbi:MAG: TetR/AcrR family transcriptional regulator C-terminal domain-containing protein [Spirochaetales bacterium]|nr:TetR/AcrR family transcriptional regulator C-terminal domain-containing protein [Spirochaetales bacterium]
MNAKGEQNRSVRNTKRRLRESLIKLVGRKPLSAVTVSELTEDADVNRSTFYFHYQDVSAMIKEMEDQFISDFSIALDALEQKSHDFITILVKCLERHMDLCRILLGANGDMAFVEKMKGIVETRCSRIWKDAVPDMSDHDARVLDSFLIGGVMSTVQAWVLDNERADADSIAAILNRLVFEGICPVIANWQTGAGR